MSFAKQRDISATRQLSALSHQPTSRETRTYRYVDLAETKQRGLILLTHLRINK